MFDIIRFIKISAIQKFFFNKVDEKRHKEILLYLKNGFITVLMICLFWMTCPLITSTLFFIYVYLGNQMTSEVAFTSIMIVNMFEYPMYSMPTALSQIAQILSSIKRVEKFLLCKEINTDHIVQKNLDNEFAIVVENGNFYWGSEKKQKKE